jgi:CHAT domain-containing protein/tetratricopeptide (TPR) repeat protein
VAGARLLRAGLRLLGWPDGLDAGTDPARSALAGRLLLSLAVAEMQQGHPDLGFDLLDKAAELIAPEHRGVLLQQRGLLLVLVGRIEDGLSLMDEAVPLLARSDEPAVLARTLMNRAMLHHIAGRVRQARADLDRCEQIAAANGMHLELAKVAHNRGYCELLDGDIPAALRAFEAAIDRSTAHGADWAPVVRVDLARLLLASGLPGEAARQLDAAIEPLRQQRMSQECAEAELTMARATLASGDPVAARDWARRAERRFHRRGNETWAAVANLTRLSADFMQRRRLDAVARGAADLSARLAELELANESESAALLSCRAHIALGRLDEAKQCLDRQRRPKLLENRLQRQLALAELSAAAGRRAALFAHAKAGLDALARHRGRFGSLDLQTGAAMLGAELVRVGLTAALDSGTPDRVFAWLERSRAQAFRMRQVRQPTDPVTVAAVEELRRLAGLVRAAEVSGRREPAAERRCAELEREIRARGWQLDGTGEHSSPVALRELIAQLADPPTVLLSFLVWDEILLVLAITERSARLVPLGGWASVAEPLARLRSDLDTLCGRRLPAALDAVIHGSVQRQLDALTGALLAPVRPILADHDLVIVPTRTLSTLPWGQLADLRGRPLVVTPSATSWLRLRRSDPPDWSAQEPLLVAGPHLANSNAEIQAIATNYRQATVLGNDAATVPATLKAMDGRGIVHLAAHGHHEQENVLFSRLDLADGPLMAHDVHQLASAPAHVVLSSCEVGRAVVRAGDELLGFTAALLYGGTRSVVSSASKVDDDTAVGVMREYHRGLVAGRQPARALADAAAGEPLVPFVCFGS